MQTSSFLEIVNRKYTGSLSAALARRQVKATDETFHVLVKSEWASLRLGYTTISPIFTRLDRQSRLGGTILCVEVITSGGTMHETASRVCIH